MGLFFTLFYIFTAYIAPQTIFGELAQFHIQLVIVILALISSLPALFRSNLLSMPQTYALIGLTVFIGLSLAFNGWVGGAPIALQEFIPNAVAFFLVLLNCRKKGHLQILIGILFLVAAYTLYQGGRAQLAGDLSSPYLLDMKNNQGQDFFRLRGLDFLSDPNDLAQFLAGLIPCLFFFWTEHKAFRNLLIVYIPVATLLFAMFLTHSRGGMVALLAATIVLFRKKIGVIPALITGGVVFVGLSALGWSGGRDVSAESGSDRVEAWSAGLDLIRSHPIFGVGYLRFTEFFPITAHNTVVVCAAELGLFGFFFWILFTFTTLRNISVAAGSGVVTPMESQEETASSVSEASLSIADAPQSFQPFWLEEAALKEQGLLSEEESRRLCGLMVVSLTGFLTAAWFLSRPYTMALFVNVGIAAAVYRMARELPATPREMPFLRAFKLSAYLSGGLLVGVYLLVRAEHMAGM